MVNWSVLDWPIGRFLLPCGKFPPPPQKKKTILASSWKGWKLLGRAFWNEVCFVLAFCGEHFQSLKVSRKPTFAGAQHARRGPGKTSDDSWEVWPRNLRLLWSLRTGSLGKAESAESWNKSLWWLLAVVVFYVDWRLESLMVKLG